MSSSSDTDPRVYRARSPGSGRSLSSRVETLASTLQDTNRNLKDVDRLLEDYKDMGERKQTAVDRLKEDLNRTSEKLRDERMKRSSSSSGRPLRPSDLDAAPHHGRRYPTSPLRDYDDKAASDWEYGSSRRQRPPPGAVRFYDDMGIHDVHQSVRDLTSDQWRMGQDLNRYITQTNRMEQDSRQAFRDITSNLAHPNSSVEERIRNIEAEMKAENKMKQEELGKISAELKLALENHKTSNTTANDQRFLETKFAQMDTQKAVIDELKGALVRGEEEKQRLWEQLQDSKQQALSASKQRHYEERELQLNEKERNRLESEVADLKSQLAKSMSAVSDYSELRKELDISEKQRVQLSDHIQNLNEELESKEKYSAKVINQLQETSESLRHLEKQEQQSSQQVGDLSKRVSELSKLNESLTIEVHETKKSLQDMEHKKEEMKMRAQETVRQWKTKCKHLEQEIGVFKKSTQTGAERVEQLLRELESTRSQAAMSSQQLDHVKREFAQMLAIRAQQEEELRVRDIQLNEKRGMCADMEREMRDCKVIQEKLEQELHSCKEKWGMALEERNKMEDQAHSFQSSAMMAQNQCQQMQREIKELSMMRVDLAAQVADLATQKQEMRSKLGEVEHQAAVANEDLQMLRERLKQEKEGHKKQVEALKIELDQYKGLENKRTQDASRYHLKQKAEYEAHIQAMKIELDEAKCEARLARKQTDKLSSELESLSGELIKSQEETAAMQIRYLELKEEFISKTNNAEDGMNKAKDIEIQMLDLKDDLANNQRDHKNSLLSIGSQIDTLIDEMEKDTSDSVKSFVPSSGELEGNKYVLAEIMGKMNWLRSEIRDQRERNLQLHKKLKETMKGNEQDRLVLVQELQHQQDLIQQITDEKKISDEKYISDAINDFTSETKDVQSTEESQLKRDMIQKRYSKLQETMANLKQELYSAVALPSESHVKRRQRSRSTSPGGRHVRIQSPPIYERCRSPVSPARRSPSPGRSILKSNDV